MAVNKVVFGGKTLIDVSGVSVAPVTLIAGATAMNSKGELIEGAADIGNTTVEIVSAIGFALRYTAFVEDTGAVVCYEKTVSSGETVTVSAMKGTVVAITFDRIAAHEIQADVSDSSVLHDDTNHTILKVGSDSPIFTITESDYPYEYSYDYVNSDT